LVNALITTHKFSAHRDHPTGLQQGRQQRNVEDKKEMAAAAAETLKFRRMTETQLRQWVEANPGRVDDRDNRETPPFIAAAALADLHLIVWLLDEKCADVNGKAKNGLTPLHVANSLDVLNALLDRGADPILASNDGLSPLMNCAIRGGVDVVARLLQDRHTRAIIDVKNRYGSTALHLACYNIKEKDDTTVICLLLQAGANTTITNEKGGETPLAYLRQHHPFHRAAIALLEQALANVEKTALLVKARRLAITSSTDTVATPSYLRRRLEQEEPLPSLALAPLTGGQDEEEDLKFHTTLTFLLGLEGGPKGEGMPRDVFLVVLNLLMPRCDPLRRGVGDLQC